MGHARLDPVHVAPRPLGAEGGIDARRRPGRGSDSLAETLHDFLVLGAEVPVDWARRVNRLRSAAQERRCLTARRSIDRSRDHVHVHGDDPLGTRNRIFDRVHVDLRPWTARVPVIVHKALVPVVANDAPPVFRATEAEVCWRLCRTVRHQSDAVGARGGKLQWSLGGRGRERWRRGNRRGHSEAKAAAAHCLKDRCASSGTAAPGGKATGSLLFGKPKLAAIVGTESWRRGRCGSDGEGPRRSQAWGR